MTRALGARRKTAWRWSNVPVPEPMLGALAAGLLLGIIVPVRLPLGTAARLAIGVPLVAGGAALAAWAVASAAETSVDRPDRLVTHGAYAQTRNPMYVGWTLSALGLAALTRSAWLAVACVAAARRLHRDVLREEAGLAHEFGTELYRYQRGVPRYMPRLGRHWAVRSILRSWPRTASTNAPSSAAGG